MKFRKDNYTPKEVAEMFSVNDQTVYKWIRTGKIKANQPSGKNGKYSIPARNLIPLLDDSSEMEGEDSQVSFDEVKPSRRKRHSQPGEEIKVFLTDDEIIQFVHDKMRAAGYNTKRDYLFDLIYRDFCHDRYQKVSERLSVLADSLAEIEEIF